MILNWVSNDLNAICDPASILSKSGKGKPFPFLPLIGFLINGDVGLMTPQSQHPVWPCTHGLTYIENNLQFSNSWLVSLQYQYIRFVSKDPSIPIDSLGGLLATFVLIVCLACR